MGAGPPTAAPAGLGAEQAGAGKALPEGFFADKGADARARGVKLPDKKDREDDFQVRGEKEPCAFKW